MKHSITNSIISWAVIFFISSSSSAQWTQLTGPEGDNLVSLASNGSTFLCGTYIGFIYRSDDNGLSWQPSCENFNPVLGARTIALNDSIAFCSFEFGTAFRSTDHGRSWNPMSNFISNGGPVEFFSIVGNTVFSGCNVDGLTMSTNYGLTWERNAIGIDRYASIQGVVEIGNELFALAHMGGPYVSTDNGYNWVSILNGLPLQNWKCIMAAGNDLYIGSYTSGIFKSTNSGVNWSAVNSGLTGLNVSGLAKIGDTIFANVYSNGVFRSINGGTNWENVTASLPNLNFMQLSASNSNLVLCNNSEMYISTNKGQSWSDLNTNGRSNDTILFIQSKGDQILACNKQGIVHISRDRGSNWDFRTNGAGEAPKCFVSTANHLLIGTSGRGILRSADLGLTWAEANSGLTGREISSIYEYDEVLYVAVRNDGIFSSGDDGNIWTRIPSSDIVSNQFGPLIVNDNTIIVAESNGVYKTTNQGMNWTQVAGSGFINNEKVQKSFCGANTMFLFGTQGLYYSTNSGESWTSVAHQFLHDKINGVYFDGDVLVINREYGILRSYDLGTTIEYISNGLYYPSYKLPLEYSKGKLYCGSQNSIYSGLYSNLSGKPFVDFYVESFLEAGEIDTIPIGCNSVPEFVPAIEVTGNQIDGADQRTTTVRYKISDDNEVFYSSTKTVKLGNGQSQLVHFDTCRLSPWNNMLLQVEAYCFSPSDTITHNDSTRGSIYLKNFNFDSTVTAFGTYYFANSTPEASCAPDQPAFWWEDTTGSTFLIKEGIPQVPLSSGDADNGTFLLQNIFNPGAEFIFYSVPYSDVEISTNGLIALGSGVNGINSTTPFSLSDANAPCPALYPFWYDLDFTDQDVTGRNLKYKMNGDMLVITYERVPLKNAGYDPDYHMTFQIVLEPEYTDNGIFLVMFDNQNAGSTFTSRYESGNIGGHTTGIKSCNLDAYAEYCYRNSSGDLLVPGPIVGSQMAVAFGSINSVLPVELSSFTARAIDANAELHWSTTAEIHNSGFAVERKDNVSEWIKVGFVEGSGNSFTMKEYEFTDFNLNAGNYSYRLKQIDFNGVFNYHYLNSMINIGSPVEYRLSQNFPNPFNPVTKINYDLPEDAEVTLTIYDVSGRQIYELLNEFKKEGRYTISLDASNLSSGAYFYTLKANNFSATKRMLLIK